MKITSKVPPDHFPQKWNDVTGGIGQEGVIIKGKIMDGRVFLPIDDLYARFSLMITIDDGSS